MACISNSRLHTPIFLCRAVLVAIVTRTNDVTAYNHIPSPRTSDVTTRANIPELIGNELHYMLFNLSDYDSRVRPAQSMGSNVTVSVGLSLTQLVGVDEKNQIMTTSVWLRQEWVDPRLRWDPSMFHGMDRLHIPSTDIWRPDIVLYNNADGDFAITMFTKATVYNDGKIVWQPPAQYKSYCPIDVEFFPFDVQLCFMKFGVWTYDATGVDLIHMCQSQGIEADNRVVIQQGIDLRGFAPNVAWDVVNVTAETAYKYYKCCPGEKYADMKFNITIRRRTLFHIVNLIIPCIAISGLTVLVFYLPSDSGEKITLCLSILMALAVFFLLLNDIIPPTSLVMPMIGKYLLFTMVVVILSILLTVVTLSVSCRNPSTHIMTPWVRRVFTEILPRVLFMRRPQIRNKNKVRQSTSSILDSEASDSSNQGSIEWKPSAMDRKNSTAAYTPDLLKAVKGVKFIADHMKDEDSFTADEREWNYIARVIDRLFLFIFSTAVLSGSVGIFLHAPSLYDTRAPLTDDTSCIY